ncbi:hypothetical protein [Gordonia paraffinivorans]|uniref:hypothetical protein n=1 Tax=Gordonia paraffinivorans TaxID=175628 RepID=UPI001E5D2761|nr:hypothetical protein [Gordonia paraffinivorans]MCD2147560.1 hypothetical protein [Gordonia paraffinivorans]
MTYTPPPPIDTGSLRSDLFVPSRVVEYDALIGLSVPEALELLGYREGRNLYPVEPILVPTPSLGPAAPSQDDRKDLVVTGVCQTMTPERAFGENPRIERSDRIYLSTYPRSKLSPEERAALQHPQSTDERAWVEGFTVALKDQEKRCDPSIGSIAVR